MKKMTKRCGESSPVGVRGVTCRGFWIAIGRRRLFLRLADFPWFRQVAVEAIVNVEQPHSGHLYWPDLDVDLAVESIEHPEGYPLVSRVAHDSIG